MIETIFRAVDRIEDALAKVEPVALRDRFAMAALTGIMANPSYTIDSNEAIAMGGCDAVLAHSSYQLADAMMKARE